MLIMYDAFTSMNYTLDERKIMAAFDASGESFCKPDGTTIVFDASGLLTVNPNLFYSKSELDAKLSSMWRWRGVVETLNDLPTSGNKVGDVITVRDDGSTIGKNAEYGWDGKKWEFIGPTLDMSGYALTTTVKDLISAHASDYVAHVTLADRKVWDQTTVDVDNHINNADVHVTAEEKTAWSNKADASVVESEVQRAKSAEAKLSADIKDVDKLISFGTCIDRIWIYGNNVFDLNLMVKPGLYYCSADANVVGQAMLNMPEGTSEGCLMVLKNSQIFYEGGTAKGRTYYRYQTGAGPTVSAYTEGWTPTAMVSDVEELRAAIDKKFLDYTTDYTAFEVYPTDAVIPAGTIDDVTGHTYKYEVPASMTASFVLRTNNPTAESDVVVDFGDGTIKRVADAAVSDTQADGNELNVLVEHTYSTPGRYIVKIMGRKYFGFTNKLGNSKISIVSRMLAPDLPLASHVNVIGSMAMWSRRLLAIDIPAYTMAAGLFNCSTFLQEAINLVSVTGAKYIQASVRHCGTMFKKCYSLTTTDFIIPGYIRDGNLSEIFAEAANLKADINKLIPVGGFIGGTYNMYRAFYKCAKLYGTVPASKLWEHPTIVWTNTSQTFAGCSDAIRAQVPTSWGGTNTEIETKLQAGYWKHATVNDVASKVDKEDGKGLSQEDFTTEYKNKIHALESELEAIRLARETMVVFIGSTTEEPSEYTLEVGKVYVTTGPFRAWLPSNPTNGAIIRVCVETGMEDMWVDATEETTITGTKQEVAVGMTPEGLLINNASYTFVFNASTNNWIVF